jgi:hypothetical protein
MTTTLESNTQIERLIPRGSIGSFSYGSLLDVLIDNEFHVVFPTMFAEESGIGKMVAFQVCRRSPGVSIQ